MPERGEEQQRRHTQIGAVLDRRRSGLHRVSGYGVQRTGFPVSGLLPSKCSIEDGKAKMEVWRRQGETNGRPSKFPDMVEEIETIRGNDELAMKCVCT